MLQTKYKQKNSKTGEHKTLSVPPTASRALVLIKWSVPGLLPWKTTTKMATKISTLIVDLWREKIDVFDLKKKIIENKADISIEILIGKPFSLFLIWCSFNLATDNWSSVSQGQRLNL